VLQRETAKQTQITMRKNDRFSLVFRVTKDFVATYFASSNTLRHLA